MNQTTKKIGIITHYYESLNYGGNLQAFALVSFLNNNGFNAEQICLSLLMIGRKDTKIIAIAKKFIKSFFLFVVHNKDYKKTLKINRERKNKLVFFNQKLIKNNGIEYNDNNIFKIKDNYNYFITGSDQVWNPGCFLPSFYLEFVDDNNKKISYAASMACDDILSRYKNRIIKDISSFKAISVRESNSKTILSKYIDNNVELAVDPTLLLEKKDWDLVKDKKCKYKDYILCCFLGNSDKERKLALEFAKTKKLKIISILMANNGIKYFDIDFGDIRLIPTPQEYISLIENANYVFTDSFHACIFSYIYRKQFFVFNRDYEETMNTRIYDLMDRLDTNNRFCDSDSKLTIKYLLSIDNCKYRKNSRLDMEIQKSKEFLISNLNDG